MRKSLKSMTNEELQLLTIKQSRTREIMPRPVIFKDKTKFDRNKNKKSLRKEIQDY